MKMFLEEMSPFFHEKSFADSVLYVDLTTSVAQL
jgi:hypothetical protein